MSLLELLTMSVKNKASDLHISAELPPLIRVDGELCRLTIPPLDKARVHDWLNDILTTQQQKLLEERLQIDFSLAMQNVARFRVTIFHQLRGLSAVFRIIPNEIMTLEALALPKILQELTRLKSGLVLVTGATGSGKSTTLAAMIDFINQTRSAHIITIEDPIEFIHQSKQCLISQREVQRNAHSFNAALRSALRADPDVILIGELRDLETIQLALTAAETGHLVFATLHTSSATKTIHRLIDVFAGEEKNRVRTLLAESLQAVIAQTLIKRQGEGRIAAIETMICTHAIRNLIREDKVAQMYSVMQTGQNYGMHTLDQYLQSLVKQRTISSAVAREVAVNKALFQ